MAVDPTAPTGAASSVRAPGTFLTAIFAVNLLAFLNFVTVFIGLLAIGQEFDAAPALVLQLPTALFAAIAFAAPVTPYLLRRLGVRRLLVLAICGMSLTTVAAAFASNLWMLVGVLFVHGVFCAPIAPATQAAISHRMDEGRRSLGMAIWGAGNYASCLIGPLLAGWLDAEIGWRAILLIPLPFALAALPLVLLAMPRTDTGREGGDAASLVLAPLTVLALVAFVSLGPGLGWFRSDLVVVTGVVFLIGAPLYLWRYRVTALPRFHMGWLRDRNAALALFIVFVFNMVSTGIFQVEFLGQEAHITAEVLGLRSAAGGAALIVGFVVAGWLGGRHRLDLLLLGGLAVTVAGKAGYLTYGTHVDALQAIWPVALMNVGFGMVTGALATLAYRTLPVARTADLATAFILAIYLGAALGAGLLDEAYVVFDGLDLSDGMSTDTASIAAYDSEFWVEMLATAALVVPALALLRNARSRTPEPTRYG